MKTAIVEVEFTGNNFSAHLPQLPGCISVGNTPAEMKANIAEAVAFHIKSSLADGDPLPAKFKGKFALEYKFDTMSLLNYYKGIFSKAGLERLTGINQKQLHHYATGHRSPRPAQAKKIETALHTLGRELLAVEL